MEIALVISVILNLVLVTITLSQSFKIENNHNRVETLKQSFFNEKIKLLSIISYFSSYQFDKNGEIQLIEINDKENEITTIGLN